MLVSFALLAPLLFFGFWMMKKWTPRLGAAAAPFGPAPGPTDFFAQSGYRYAGMEQASLEAQAQRASVEGSAIVEGHWAIHYVRWVGALRVDFRQASFQSRHLARFPGGEGAATAHGSFTLRGSRGQQNTTLACSWRATPPQPPRVQVHVAERTLGGPSFGGARPWAPRAPHRFEAGLEALDRRFQLYAFDPAAAHALLHAQPALVERLLACVEVDLWVDDRGAELADPELHNLHGGREPALRIPADPGAHLRRQLEAHDRVTALLAAAVSQ